MCMESVTFLLYLEPTSNKLRYFVRFFVDTKIQSLLKLFLYIIVLCNGNIESSLTQGICDLNGTGECLLELSH